jgi:hypothetical protein
MFISSYLYLKKYESDRTNKSNVYNEYILIQKIWTICDAKTYSRRKTYQVRYAPQNVHMATQNVHTRTFCGTDVLRCYTATRRNAKRTFSSSLKCLIRNTPLLSFKRSSLYDKIKSIPGKVCVQ